MSNILDPDQARQFVKPDLGPNCLPSLSADDTAAGRQRVKMYLLPLNIPDDRFTFLSSHSCNFLVKSSVTEPATQYEPHCEKTGFLHMRKQKRRSAAQ